MNDTDLDITTTYSTILGGNPILDGTMLTTVANGGISSLSANTINVTTSRDIDDIMDDYSMNRFAVDHKVTAQELLKLQEVAPDYAGEIKENIAKNLARDISKKVMFKKKHDKDADVHHFIGRVWVFTDDELKALLKDKNVY